MRTRLSMFRYPMQVADANGAHFVEQLPWIDTGALYSQFPASLLERLGYRPNATRTFRLADGSTFDSPVGSISLRIREELQSVVCVFAEEGSDPLIGATTLEAFSLVVDPVNETLIPTIALMLTMLPADDVT